MLLNQHICGRASRGLTGSPFPPAQLLLWGHRLLTSQV